MATGYVRTLAKLPVSCSSGTWGKGGVILVSSQGRLFSIPEKGGRSTLVMDNDTGEGLQPHFLPDGDNYVYVEVAGGWQIKTSSLSGSVSRLLVENAYSPAYVESGHLAFIQEGALMVRPFDSIDLDFAGPTQTIARELGFLAKVYPAPLSISENAVVYRQESFKKRELVWFNRQGTRLSAAAPPDHYMQITL